MCVVLEYTLSRSVGRASNNLLIGRTCTPTTIPIDTAKFNLLWHIDNFSYVCVHICARVPARVCILCVLPVYNCKFYVCILPGCIILLAYVYILCVYCVYTVYNACVHNCTSICVHSNGCYLTTFGPGGGRTWETAVS